MLKTESKKTEKTEADKKSYIDINLKHTSMSYIRHIDLYKKNIYIFFKNPIYKKSVFSYAKDKSLNKR